MLYVLLSFFFAIIGLLMKGLYNLSLAELAVIFALPIIILYKLFGNRPVFFIYAGYLGMLGGAVAAVWGYVVTPIQYYYSIWGWFGVLAGIIATILLPFQTVLFFAVAFIKGGAGIYIGKFIAGICFGIAGMLLFGGLMSESPWSWISRIKKKPTEGDIIDIN